VSPAEVAALEEDQLPPLQDYDLIFYADNRLEVAAAQTPFTNLMKKVHRQIKWLNVTYTENALLGKREGISGQSNPRGLMTLSCLERFQLSFQALPKLEKRANKIFKNDGTTVSDLLSAVPAPDLEDPKVTWRLQWKEKQPLLGKSSIMEQVRVSDGEGGEGRSPDGIEPFNHHQRHSDLWEEVLFRFNVKSVVDLTASDGVLALVCVKERIPYVGLCHNAQHASALMTRISATIFLSMLEQNGPLYKAKLAALMSPVAGDKPIEPKPGKCRLRFVAYCMRRA
jgi:hypothetical protein